MNARTATQLVRHLGLGWAAYRAWYAVSQRAGVLQRRAPAATSWDTITLASLVHDPKHADASAFRESIAASGRRFMFDPGHRTRYAAHLKQFDAAADPHWAEGRLTEIAGGRLRYFSGSPVACGWPPRWGNEADGAPRDVACDHFSRVNEFGHGDVKLVWEPNRFAFAYDLARIYWRTGDERCAEMFWHAVEDWRRQNPPNAGINWKCGQEAALRAMAWCFGLWGFADSAHTTPGRAAALALMLAGTAGRIEANVRYALSQRNNHGVSEALGLLTVGLLFPQFRGSTRWAERGAALLERQARTLIYDDGGFSQYSANYHRVMLHDFLWAIRLAELNGRPLSDGLRRRVIRAGRFLLDIQDARTGQVPHYGHDDGALVLPLTHCDYHDFRPALQSTAALAGERWQPAGPWDEERLWLFGDAEVAREVDPLPRPAADVTAPLGGYALLRRGDDFAFVRCGDFRDRPSHADLLHVDIWWRGHNVMIDAGTYSYNAEGKWSGTPLASTASHSTVTVDGADQAPRVGRFLFLPWPRSRVHRLARSGGSGRVAVLDVEHDGYRRLPGNVAHRRAIVQLDGEHWAVIDRLTASAPRTYRLHWLATDVPFQWDPETARLVLTFPGEADAYQVQPFCSAPTAAFTLVRGDPDSPRGWHAPHYNARAPAISLAAQARGDTVCFATVLGPGAWRAAYADGVLTVRHEGWTARVALGAMGPDGPPVGEVVWTPAGHGRGGGEERVA